MDRKVRRTRPAAPSIADVAREAGVAPSTASRALTMPGRIAEPTRLKVEEAARKLGYAPNHAARDLRKGRPHTIMIVLPDELYVGASQTVPEVLRSSAQALTSKGYTLVIANVSRDEQTDQHILSLAFGGTIAGVLLMAARLPSVGERNLLQAGLPVVSVHFDMSDQNIVSIVSNDRSAIGEAVDALASKGHRRFAYIRGRPDNYHDIERLRGVQEGLVRNGISSPALEIMQGDFGFTGGIKCAHQFLSQPFHDRPTAVICANDDTAIAFIKTITESAVDVPGDVSVIGFDGAPVGAFTTPSLSTIQQSTVEMGVRAVDILTDMAMDELAASPMRIEIPCRLILRQSTQSLLGGPGTEKS